MFLIDFSGKIKLDSAITLLAGENCHKSLLRPLPAKTTRSTKSARILIRPTKQTSRQTDKQTLQIS